jgi:hypothetical protein
MMVTDEPSPSLHEICALNGHSCSDWTVCAGLDVQTSWLWRNAGNLARLRRATLVQMDLVSHVLKLNGI